MADIVDDPSFSVAMGLVLWGLEQEVGGYGSKPRSSMGESDFAKKFASWLKNFLP